MLFLLILLFCYLSIEQIDKCQVTYRVENVTIKIQYPCEGFGEKIWETDECESLLMLVGGEGINIFYEKKPDCLMMGPGKNNSINELY